MHGYIYILYILYIHKYIHTYILIYILILLTLCIKVHILTFFAAAIQK